MSKSAQKDELVIDETNFDQHFFDARKHNPLPGQVLAVYTAIAEWGPGHEKENLVDLLMSSEKANAAVQVMRKLFCASEKDAMRVPREICHDLLSGMTRQQVIDKVYRYQLESHYYTQEELVPKNDPHWSVISLLNIGRATAADGLVTTVRIVESSEKKEPATI